MPGRGNARAHPASVFSVSEAAAIRAAFVQGDVSPNRRKFRLARTWSQIKHPAGISDLAAGAGGSPELGAQIYAAAVLSAGEPSPAETAFLAKLATALNLDPGLVANLRAAAAPAT